MPQYILLDTCCLRNLVVPTEPGFNLSRLIYWVQNGDLELLVPTHLKEEWQKHREEKRKELKKKQKDQLRILEAEYMYYKVDRGPIDLSAGDKIVDDQLKAIDHLLDTGIQIDLPPDIKAQADTLFSSRLPPLHNKPKSLNDAYILLSTLQYCSKHKKTPAEATSSGDRRNWKESLLVVSSNTKDYTDRKDLSKLHPEIQALFPSVYVDYYLDAIACFTTLEQNGFPSPPLSRPKRDYQCGTFPVDRSAPIADQVYDFLIEAFKEWSFLPQKFLLDQYPFKTDSNKRYYRPPFVLYINNPPVYQFLTGIKNNGEHFTCSDVNKQDDEGFSERLLTIVTTLNHNLVYFLTEKETGRDAVSFFSFNILLSPALMGSYLRFEYNKLFDLVTSVEMTTAQLLEVAYVQYRMGNFAEAVDSCRKGELRALEKKEDVLYYICRHNLKVLGLIIRGYYPDHPEQHAIAAELRQINIDEAFNHSKNARNENLLAWFHNDDMLRDYTLKIFTLLGKIRSDYYTNNAGFNDNFPKFVFQFQEFHGFLIYNYIFFEEQESFQEIFNAFTEGTIASYGCSPELGGRLHQFNDELLLQLVRYGKYQSIRSYLFQYTINTIGYTFTEHMASFTEVFKNFLLNYPATTQAYTSQGSLKTQYFWNQYNRKFLNFLLLFSYLELPESKIVLIAGSLFSFLKEDRHLQLHELTKALSIFIEKKGQYLDLEMLMRYLDLSLLDDRYQDLLLIVNLCDEARKKNGGPVEVSAGDFEAFRLKYLPTNAGAIGEKNMDIIAQYYDVISNPPYKSEIKTFIETVLQWHFDFQVFYTATITKIIQPGKPAITQYHNEMNGYILQHRTDQFDQVDLAYIDHNIDDYLNFVFWKNYPLPNEILLHLKKIGPYYEWLLDMEHFDYGRFSYNWLSYYFTIYYKKRYMKCAPLKNYLLDYIRQYPKSAAQGAFIRIFDME